MRSFEKAPVGLLDYRVDWSDWLAEGETIITSEWEVPDGLLLSASTKTDTSATAWLEGGRAHNFYRVTNRITTSENRVDERSINIHVVRR